MVDHHFVTKVVMVNGTLGTRASNKNKMKKEKGEATSVFVLPFIFLRLRAAKSKNCIGLCSVLT